jgi:outer membrane protein TolC
MFVSFSYGETFKEIVKKALQSSPYIKSIEYGLKSYEGQIIQAKRSLNPQIQLEFGRLISETESGFSLTLQNLLQVPFLPKV